MRGPAFIILLTLLGAVAASAQMPAPGAAAPPAPPDTLVARFSWVGAGPAPRGLTVTPAETRLGDVVTVIIDLPASAAAMPADSVQVDVDWLEAARDVAVREPAGLPPAAGARLLVPYRIYRLGPWRPAWGDGAPGPMLAAANRLDDGASFVPVRDPRLLGGLPLWVLVLAGALVVAVLALLGWWRLRGRPAAAQAADRPLPPPAWLQAAIDLWRLEESQGHDRTYLDTLAAVLRRYLHARFHLPAEEMTAAEIAAAARRTGWPASRLKAFAGILAGCDQARYAPTSVGARQCRDGMQRLLDLIDAERIEPVWSPVPADRRAAATSAWKRLRDRYPDATRGGPSC